MASFFDPRVDDRPGKSHCPHDDALPNCPCSHHGHRGGTYSKSLTCRTCFPVLSPLLNAPQVRPDTACCHIIPERGEEQGAAVRHDLAQAHAATVQLNSRRVLRLAQATEKDQPQPMFQVSSLVRAHRHTKTTVTNTSSIYTSLLC